jgi:hypothetical protein
MMPDPTGDTPQEWLLEINDAGDFWFKITRATASRLETGTFKAKDGKWQWTTRGDEQSGTYRVIDTNSIELTGILGTARWMRVQSIAQQSSGISPKPNLVPQKPGLFPKDVPPAPKVPATGTPPSTGGRVLFEDDFRTKRQLLDQTGPFCKTSYGDGGLIVEDVALQGRCRLILSNAGEFRANVRIEVSARLRRGGQNYGYGLMFGRTQDGRSYYTLTINKDGYYTVSLNQDGKWTPLLDWKQDPAVKLGYGSMNRMAVEVQGRSIRAYINDKHVGVVQSPAEPTGQIGFYLDLLGMETVFSDLRVTELPRVTGPTPQVSSKSPGPPVAGGRVLFEDNFRTQQWRSGIGDCAKSSYGDGGFIVENIHQSSGCGFRLSEAGKFSGNVRIELTAALRKGRQDSGYGLVFGMEEPGRSRFYTFYVTADGWYGLLANRDSKVLIQWTKHPSVRTGYNGSNNLIVEIQDRTIKVLINGIQVGVVQAPAAIVGSIELGTGWPGMEVIFTNVRVTELPMKRHVEN